MAYNDCNTGKLTLSHLNAFERGQIQALYQEDKSLQEIADIIEYHKSSFHRELIRDMVMQRNSDLNEYQAYFTEAGQAVYEKNHAHCGAKYKLAEVVNFIHFAVDRITEDKWSPDTICGHVEDYVFVPTNRLSNKDLYTYLDAG